MQLQIDPESNSARLLVLLPLVALHGFRLEQLSLGIIIIIKLPN
jgi:hypothetical protein